jgi:hypothetical protein
MTRQLSPAETRIALSRVAQVPPDDVDGYVLILVKGDDISLTVSNADSYATQVGVIGRALEHLAAHISAAAGQATAQ